MWLFLSQDWKNKASEKNKGIVEAFAHSHFTFCLFVFLTRLLGG